MNAAHPSSLDPKAEEQLLLARRVREISRLEGQERATRWLFAASFFIIAIPLAIFASTDRSPSPALVVALIAAYALASRVKLEVGTGYTTPSQLVLVPMLFLLPARFVPLAVMLALVIGQLPEFVRRAMPIARVSVVIGNAWYSIGPALVFLAFGEPSAHFLGWGVLVIALLAQYSVDFTTSVACEWLALRVPARVLVRPLLWVFAVDTFLAPMGLCAAIAFSTNEASLILPLPLLGLIYVFAAERKRRIDNALELSTAYRGTAFVLADVIEADDEYTGSHSRQVLDLVLAVSEKFTLDTEARLRAEFAALLHDVGKVKIPTEIINKPGKLSADEWELMKTHAAEGERLLLPVGGLLADVGRIVRYCHERYDGAGYPDKVAGDAIPLVARIVCCCDAFNAMITDRPYAKRKTVAAALDELIANKGTQFDPDVVDALVEIVWRQPDVYMTASSVLDLGE